MFALIHSAEALLAPLFKGLPALPRGARETLVKIWPILALVLGILQILAVVGLWRLAHTANQIIDYSNALAKYYDYQPATADLGLFYWLAIVALVVDAVILLAAYPKLKARQKKGWDLLLLAALLNFVYGVFSAFDSAYGSFGNLLGSVIGTAIGLYLLFQIRDSYIGKVNSGNAPKK